MKKAILIFLLIIGTASAQIDISMTEYDSVSQKARIRLHNTGAIDYRNLVLSVDSVNKDFPGSILKPGSAILIPINIPSGQKEVMVRTSDSFVFKETLNFAKDFDQVRQERQRQDIVDAEVRATEQQIQKVQKETELQNSPQLSKKNYNILWILPPAIILIILIFLYLKKRPKKPVIRQTFPRKTINYQGSQSAHAKQYRMQSPVTRVVLHNPSKLQKQNPKTVQPQNTDKVFASIPKSSNAFDRIPSKNNKNIFDKLGALR